MDSRFRHPIALVLVSAALLLAGCDSEPLLPEPSCTLAAIGQPLTGVSIDAASLRGVLDDAANRVAPSLLGEAGAAAVVDGVRAVSARVDARDYEEICRAFNDAVAAVDSFADRAPDRHRPDIGAIRLALGLARVWLSSQG